ncbi:MAG: DNA-processing protein DprA, partial [Proteobacteria bacterium]|nr:DNA-processing protein DprA [Pseudomonadota bacterium]
ASLRAWLLLQEALRFEPELAAACLRRHSEPALALASSGRSASAAPADLDRWARLLAQRAAVGLPLTAPAYPARLAVLPDPPPLLWVRGDPTALAADAVAIVGARAATAYGLGVARSLARGLAEQGLVIVSGLARGIDAAAHRGALEAGGRTVAVLACGPDQVYPSEHRKLADEIAERGAVVTEHPPETPPLGHYFPLRNRLISGLARAVIVVEARGRSGSLITARHAAGQGRDVMAVPGPIDGPVSAGPNRLIRDGARPVLGVGDVLEELQWERCTPEQPAPAEADTAEVGAIVCALRHAPLGRDELCRELGRSPEALALDLVNLELEGRVVEDRDGRLRLMSSR